MRRRETYGIQVRLANILSTVVLRFMRPTERAYSIPTASGVVAVSHEAEVYIQGLNTLVFDKFVDNSATVRSLGSLCDEMDCSYTW